MAEASAPVAEAAAVELRELRRLAQVNLRVDPADARVAAAVAASLGTALPSEPNTVASHAGRAVLWLGPDEWLVTGPGGSEIEIEDALREALAGAPGSVVDLSANRTALELSGPAAREVLMKGCWLDLHPRSFTSGRCAQTALARTQVILWQVSDEPRYRILVRPSFAPYLADWLADAMAEWRR